ncbi:MAG: TolB family protein [Planctomycetota bacterium]
MPVAILIPIWLPWLATATEPEAATTASSPHQPGDLVFFSDRSGGGDLFQLLWGESRQTPLSINSKAAEWGPRWDAARQRIVVAQDKADGTVLIAVAPHGADTVTLFANPSDEEVPSWSPDGKWIAYSRAVDGNRDLYVADSSGKNTYRLTTVPADDKQPTWGPDSRTIAFVSARNGNDDIWTIERTGESLRRITNHAAMEGHPAWSPDGQRIVFDRYENGSADIYVVAMKTGIERRLTKSAENELVPRFSLDGRWVSFGSTRDGNWEVYMIATEGGEARRITSKPGFDGDAIWVRLPRPGHKSP